ncbi:MAG: LPXTG cell wall anchor domain-containing protein, partial [Anaerotignum sp.]|nr:LPXTG cell wall anchor domain-containing protein [Anaerotignum sp.]
KEEFKYNDNTNKKKEKEEKKDEENKDGGNEYTEEYIIDDGDVPLAELPEVDIPLADIILDDVPKTNDTSALWLALSGFSGIGLAGLFGRKRRK